MRDGDSADEGDKPALPKRQRVACPASPNPTPRQAAGRSLFLRANKSTARPRPAVKQTRGPRSRIVQGDVHRVGAVGHDMGVDHGRFEVLVAQQFLHRADVVAGLEQVRGEGMAEGVRRDPLGRPHQAGSSASPPPETTRAARNTRLRPTRGAYASQPMIPERGSYAAKMEVNIPYAASVLHNPRNRV